MKASSAMEAITSAKKKKMKQARLPFQALNASKSSSDTNNAPSKKRKTTSPLERCTKSKVRKYRKKGSCMSVCKGKEDDEEEHSVEEIEIISDEEKEDSERDCKNKTVDIMPESSSEKNKKVDKLHEKPGALTKFLKKADNKVGHGLGRDSNVCESRDEPNCSNKFVHNEEDDIYNKSSDAHSVKSTLQHVSRVNENLENDNVTSKNTGSYSSCQGSDSDIAILSSDNEMLSDLNKSVTSGNEETTNKSASSSTTSPALALRDDKNIKKRKLTQKQLSKRQEIAKRKEEKEKLKMEREKKREEEKANRRKKKEEKQREKEEKERIEKEQKKKEKELKEFKKQMEIEQKQKEKEAKEEERRKREEAKEEEKRRKEEEKLEAERKKQKAASNFASFFVSKKQEVKSVEEFSIIEPKNFMPFEVKADMKIAPVRRRILTKHEKSLFDEKCNVDMNKSELYLESMRKQKIVLRTSSKTWPLETKDDIILLDEDNDDCSNIIRDTHNLEKHRPKLLQFGDNRRPPYWGTWRKRSNIINPRRPFVKDKKWFDYEIDSDDEWEEEEPGESLKGSDDEKDEENPEENEYDVDNEFMVPHGYLSDEEARADEEEMEDMSPQTQKMKLKLLGEQFEAERNAKTNKLKPKIIGCIWQGFRNTFSEFVPTKVLEFLSIRQAWVSHLPIVLPSSETSQNDTASNIECKAPTQQSGRNTKKTKVPQEALPDLIRLVHGNTHGRHFLLKEFMTFWSRNDKAGERQLSKVSVLQKIKELANWMACPEEGPMHLKNCWYVSKNIRKQYLPNENLTLPNRWTYILIPHRKTDTQDVTDKTEKEEKEKEKRHVPLITQFTKKITQEEMKKQLAMKPDQVSAVIPKLSPLQRPPKRVTLISVSRGESFPERSRENVLAKL